MATVKRTLSTKTNGNGKSEILLRLTVKRGFQLRLRSNLFVKPEHYGDGSLNKARPGSALYTELAQIKKTLSGIEQHLFDICQEEPIEKLTKEYLQERIQQFLNPAEEDAPTAEEAPVEDAPKKLKFFEILQQFIDHRKISEWRRKRYEVLQRALLRYEMYRKIRHKNPYKLDLETFSVDDINDFETFLRSEDSLYEKYPKIYEKYPSDTRKTRKKAKPLAKGDNTIINMFGCLRSFFKDCIEQGYMEHQPFTKYKGSTTEHYGTPYYITLEERDIIANFDFGGNKHLETQRDIFIFHTLIGCRVSDLMRLTPNDVINGAIEYIAQKTMKDRPNVIRVPLNQRGKDLIEKYKGADRQGRLFPFISQQKYNKAIKEIFTRCGITRMVTILNAATGKEEKKPLNEIASSHLARRTFVGNLYKKVKDQSLVGALSGHAEGSRAFARYRQIDEDMKKEIISILD